MTRADKKLFDPKSLPFKHAWAVAACGLFSSMAAGCVEPPPGVNERLPFRDSWQTVVDQDFIHTGSDGVAQIFELAIGGREDGDNFANRGDIIIDFDAPANRIVIDMRRFTFSTNEEGAQADFDDLSLWAFTSSVGRPQDQKPEDNCVEQEGGVWQNGCEVRVYFDGQSQLKRSGADFRVSLPPDYRYKLTATTQDNIEEEDFLNRGNVCVSNLFASATIETESGKVWASLADDVTPAPQCSQDQIDKCESWTQDDGNGNQVAAPWAPECDCIAVGGGLFGRLEIKSRENTAADITVDMPAGLWASVKAENQGDGQEESGEHCDAAIEVANFAPNETGNDFSWQAFGNVNFPGEPAISGAGFSVQAISAACQPVAYTESPADFVGVGNGDDQDSEERGNVRVCTDCIVQSCDELIP